jgi:hypothetical protein
MWLGTTDEVFIEANPTPIPEAAQPDHREPATEVDAGAVEFDGSTTTTVG